MDAAQLVIYLQYAGVAFLTGLSAWGVFLFCGCLIWARQLRHLSVRVESTDRPVALHTPVMAPSRVVSRELVHSPS